MSRAALSAEQAMAELAGFDTIIDARSEDEFALDHLPGAVNWPSLNNDERRIVGTLYKQVSPFDARKRGAALVAANLARHIEREVLDKPKGWSPLVYCWRGGKRSGALALVLDQIGFRVSVIEGGYQAFRRALLAALPPLVEKLQFQVVCGPTGSGKTRLLKALAALGAQVLDLEELASHRSSVLGVIPGQPQPSQKAYDTLIWDRLRSFDPARPIYVESESRKVGNLAVPECLMLRMRASPCWALQLPDDERVELLMEDYAFFVSDPGLFCSRLDALTEVRGRVAVEGWKEQVRRGEFRGVVRELLTHHYDPGYATSTRRNFVLFEQARPLAVAHRGAVAMRAAAQGLLDFASGRA